MKKLCLSGTLVATLLCAADSKAASYASGVTNNSGTISFVLNEDADDVKVVFDGGASTLELGSQAKGAHSFALGSHSTYQIVVTKSAGPGYPQGVLSQISSDTNNFVKFANGRGIAINNNPASSYFGRIYVSCGSAGTANGRSTGDGIYLLNSDQTDAVGQGDAARAAGINFNQTSQTEGPYRITVGSDDALYIADDSDVAGTVWITDPNVTGSTNLFPNPGGPFPVTASRNHGSALAVHPEGSLAAGNLVLYVMDEDLQSDPASTAKTELNSIWQYDINSNPLPYAAQPVKFASPLITTAAQYADMRRGPDGKWYCSQRRAVPGTTSGVIIRAADGSANIWTSLQASRDALGDSAANDILVETRSVAVSPDNKYLATMNSTNGIFILPMTDGIPDMTKRVFIATSPAISIGRSIAFDPAGNLYTLSSGQGFLRIYSRGGYTVATTGSDGSFDVFSPATTVSVSATDDSASESGDAAEITFTRDGDLSGSLTVNYSLSGTAQNGSDYSLPGTLTFGAGESTVTLPITATDDNVAEFTENIVVTVTGTPNYSVGTSGTATIIIVDNETPELSITAVSPSMYERTAGDYSAFRITRKGDTNTYVPVSIAYSGTAASSRYSGPANVDFEVGAINTIFQVTPVDDSVLNGDQTIIASLLAGSGYTVGATNSASTTIIDDEIEPETNVLFADALSTDSSAQWTVRFGANNLINDYTAAFGVDLASEGLPAAPNGATAALKLTVNKDEGTTNGAAGINVYPTGKTFSGDYAVRFNMYFRQNDTSGTTEYATFGINHSGDKVNWVRQSGSNVYNNPPVDTDGLWVSIISDGSANLPGDYALLTSTNAASSATVVASAAATSFVETFKKPPFTPGTAAGVPANINFSATPNWADVEIKHVGNVVTLSINKTQIMQYTNTTPFTSGNVMLGYMDAFESVGYNGGAVFYSNLRVINLGSTEPQAANITGIQIVGGNVQIDFAGAASDNASAFHLQGATTLNGTFNDDGSASITQQSAGVFRATVPVSGTTHFYRIRR